MIRSGSYRPVRFRSLAGRGNESQRVCQGQRGDFLASYALQLDVEKHLLQHPPYGLRRLLDEDEHGVGQNRLVVVI